MARGHNIEVSQFIWEWGQQKSGKIVPASYFRQCLEQLMINDIGEDNYNAKVGASIEDRWAAIGMEINPMDDEFTEARNTFVEQYGGEDKSIAFFTKGVQHGIREPRAWLMSWWNKRKPQAV